MSDPKAQPIHALKALTEIALAARGTEPLVVYDSVEALALRLSEMEPDPAARAAWEIFGHEAASSAEALREVDRRHHHFLALLKSGGQLS
jgi:hypothetical protein